MTNSLGPIHFGPKLDTVSKSYAIVLILLSCCDFCKL